MNILRVASLVSALFSTLILLPQTAAAQQRPDPLVREAERLQERELERQRAREQELLERQQTAPSGVELETEEVAAVDEGQCVAIDRVEVAGMTVFKQSSLAEPLSGLISDCTSIGSINAVLRIITNRYITSGYVTSRALIGPQDLNDGVLEITVVEGGLAEIKSTEDGYGAGTLGAAFPGLTGGLLNLRDLEQGVDQLARLPSYEANIDIEPGEVPGTSNLLVSRTQLAPAFRPSLSLNNDGSLSTGRIQSSIGVDADNVLGIADFWSGYWSRSIASNELRGSEGFGGFVSVPLGYWTASINAGRFTYESILDANGQLFRNDGDSVNGSATLDRLLYRDAKTKIGVSASLSLIDTENRIQGIRLSTSSYRLVSGAIDWRLQRRTEAGLITAGFGLTRGFDILGASAADTGPGGPGLSFRVLDFNLGYRQQVQIGKVPVSYSALLRGQSALDPVFSANRFNLGGSSTVRGFRDDGLSGRHGLSFRQQVDIPLLATFTQSEEWRGGLSGFAGYDAGGIFKRSEDRFERGFLHSATLGLRYASRRASFELSASRPLAAPSFVSRRDVELAFTARLGI